MSGGPAASAPAAKMLQSRPSAGDRTWFARLRASWWNFNRRHYKTMVRVSGVSLIVLVSIEIWLISTIVRAWICWSTPGCFFDGRGRVRYLKPRGNDSSDQLAWQQPYATPRLVIIDAYMEAGIKAEAGIDSEEVDDTVTVRGRCYGATRVVNFTCNFECSIDGYGGRGGTGDGVDDDDAMAALQRLSKAIAAAAAGARSVAARVQTWQSEYHAFQLSCGGGPVAATPKVTRATPKTPAAGQADRGGSNRCETTVTLQVTAYVDGVRQSSQKYALLEMPNAPPVAVLGGGTASPDGAVPTVAAARRRLTSQLKSRTSAAVCASSGGRRRLLVLPQFIEWMEWMLLLGFDRVFVFDDDDLEELAPARDFYVSGNRLTVMRRPSRGTDDGPLGAEAPSEEAMSTARSGRVERGYADQPVLLNPFALGMLGLGNGGMTRDGGAEMRRQPSSAAAAPLMHTADCLEKLSRRYAFVAVLNLGDVIIPFDEPDMPAILDRLAADKRRLSAGDGGDGGDAIFHFPGATYYSSFQTQAFVGGATRVLSYSRRTRLSRSRGRRVYRAPSMDRFNSSLEWLHRRSAGNVVHVSSLEAWARLYGDNCFGSEEYLGGTCSDLFEDDPQWLHRFSVNISTSTRRVAEVIGYAKRELRPLTPLPQ